MATSRTIAAQGELIEDSEVVVIFDGLLDGALGSASSGIATTPDNAVVFAMLPDVVTGAAGAAVDFLAAIEIRCTGARGLRLDEYNTGRQVAYCPPFSSLVLRSFDVGGDTSILEWKLSDNRKEIVADANQTHVADLTVTDGTTAASNTAVSMSDTWAAATVQTEWDTELDVVTADYDTKTATSFTEVQTTVASLLALLAGGLVQATS